MLGIDLLLTGLVVNFNQAPSGRLANEQGLSLIELMIAVCIMAFIFAGLYEGISATFNLIDVTRENLRATQILVSRIEGLRLCAWSNDQLFNTNVVPQKYTDSFYPLGLNLETNQGVIYSGTISVTTNFALNPPSTYNDQLALVTISATWTTSHGSVTNIHQRSMTTYIAQHGMQNYIYSH